MISARTRAALASAKARGQILGSPKLPQASALGRQRQIELADEHAQRVLPVLQHIVRVENITSVHALAQALTERRVPTARGGAWHGSTVWFMLKRLGYASIAELASRPV